LKKQKKTKLLPHPKDIEYERNKKLVDTLGMPMGKRWSPRQTFSNNGAKGALFHIHRRGLLQFLSYLDADMWSKIATSGPSSFFIRGYKWPWHTQIDYRGLLFPTNAAPHGWEKRTISQIKKITPNV
jgi:hypothetical protein